MLVDFGGPFVTLWPWLFAFFNTGVLEAAESGGILFLETFVPFFTARMLVRRQERLMQLTKTLLLVAATMALIAIPEALTGKPFFHQIASAITGNGFAYSPESRFGIWRSYGPTDHPIILGSICAGALSLGLALSRRGSKYVAMTGLSFAGVVASASSAPLLSAVAQCALLLWSRVLKGQRYKWWMLIALLVFIYVVIDVLSNRDPIRVMFSYLLFNEHNGYVRYNMWINSFFLAGQSFESWLIGYGFSTEMMSLLENDFWSGLMSVSIDSYWMVIMLRYGVPMLIFHLIFVIAVLRANAKYYRRSHRKQHRMLLQAWLVTAVGFSLIACTVHFWGSTASLFFIIMGATCMRIKRPEKAISDSKSNRAGVTLNHRKVFSHRHG